MTAKKRRHFNFHVRHTKDMFRIILSLVLLGLSSSIFAGHPECSGVDRWATSMAFVHLKNAGITDNQKLDFTKTKTIRLASELIGDDLYQQIHLVTFTEKSGNVIKVITSNEASNEECSMSGVKVYVISSELGE